MTKIWRTEWVEVRVYMLHVQVKIEEKLGDGDRELCETEQRLNEGGQLNRYGSLFQQSSDSEKECVFFTLIFFWWHLVENELNVYLLARLLYVCAEKNACQGSFNVCLLN